MYVTAIPYSSVFKNKQEMNNQTSLDIHLIEAILAKDDNAVDEVCYCLLNYSKNNYEAATHFSQFLLSNAFRLSFKPHTEVDEIIDRMIYTATGCQVRFLN